MARIQPSERILIVEADPTAGRRLATLMTEHDLSYRIAKDASEALQYLQQFPVEMILCDEDVEGLDQYDLVPQLKRGAPGVPLVLMTSRRDSQNLARIIERGACDVLTKPIAPDEMALTLHRARTNRNLRRNMNTLKSQYLDSCALPPLAGASPDMIDLLESLEQAAIHNAPLLIQGEVGCYKENVARALHDLSPHQATPFGIIRCTADSAGGSEIRWPTASHSTFVAERGDHPLWNVHGTLFLANIDKLNLNHQTEVLHIIQSANPGTGSVHRENSIERIVASTHADLERRVLSGTFLKELYEELNRNRLTVPPLRSCKEDIPLLADHWCRVFATHLGRGLLGLNDEAMSRLRAHSWPGNLRELEAVIRLAVSRAESDRITLTDLPLDLLQDKANQSEKPEVNLCLKHSRQRAEAGTIRRALTQTNGNRTHAAKLLQISHRALLYKLKAYGIRD